MDKDSQSIGQYLGMIDRLALSRFVSQELADEAVIFVLDKLQDNNSQRLRSYHGQAKFQSFVITIVLRLFEDFSRRKYGRVRPPLWLTKLGGSWLVLYRLLCLERFSYNDACQIAIDRLSLLMAQIEEIAEKILEEVIDCGHRRGQQVAIASDELESTTNNLHQPQDTFDEDQKKIVLRLIFTAALGEKVIPNNEQDQLFALDFKLKAEDKLYLKLCFQDDLSVSDAGRYLGHRPHQAHGKVRRILAKLRKVIGNAGLSDEVKAFLLNNNAVDN